MRTRTYTNIDSVAYYTPRLYGNSLLLLGYKPVQHVTVLKTVGNCNTMVSIIILYYYNLMEAPSYMQSVVNRNIMRCIPVLDTRHAACTELANI